MLAQFCNKIVNMEVEAFYKAIACKMQKDPEQAIKRKEKQDLARHNFK